MSVLSYVKESRTYGTKTAIRADEMTQKRVKKRAPAMTGTRSFVPIVTGGFGNLKTILVTLCNGLAS